MPYKIGLYIRVSTEEQALRTEGSLDSQLHRLTGYVDIKNMQQTSWGMVIDKYIDDGFSAKDTNRPALQKLIKDLKKGKINMILVTDLSRLSRSIRDFCGLLDLFKETKGEFLSLKEQFDTTTAAGEMMLFNMINLAQFERRQISERVSMNFHSRSLRGLRNGGAAPLGFKLDPNNKAILVVNEKEVPFVKKIFEIYLTEGSLYKAAIKLREMEIPSKASVSKRFGTSTAAWGTQMLSSLLKNYNYIGMKEVNKKNKETPNSELKTHEHYQLVKAAWPAIIDETTFNYVQKMLGENLKKERTRRSANEERVYLLTGIIACAECGRSLVGAAGHGNAQVFRYYVHRRIEGKAIKCHIKTIRADEIEGIMVDHLARVVSEENYFDKLESKISEIQNSSHSVLIQQKFDFEKDLTDIKNVRDGLFRIQSQTYDTQMLSMYSDQLKELQAKTEEKKNQLKIICEKLEDNPSPSKARILVETNVKRFQKAWPKSPMGLRKKLLRTIFEKLLVHADGIHVFYYSDEETKTTLSTGSNPVDFKAFAENRKLANFASHNEKDTCSDIVRFGCGNRI